MSSNEIDRWLQRWPGVASRVNVNVPAAQGLAKSARVNIERAQKALAAKDFDAAVIWAELALVNGADAILQKDGVRPRPSRGTLDSSAERVGSGTSRHMREAAAFRATRPWRSSEWPSRLPTKSGQS